MEVCEHDSVDWSFSEAFEFLNNEKDEEKRKDAADSGYPAGYLVKEVGNLLFYFGDFNVQLFVGHLKVVVVFYCEMSSIFECLVAMFFYVGDLDFERAYVVNSRCEVYFSESGINSYNCWAAVDGAREFDLLKCIYSFELL